MSDITASSEFGIDRNFDLNLLELDITSGLIELPQNLTNAANRISASCPTDEEARFVTSGRGFLLVNPQQTLQNEIVLQDLRNNISSSPTPPLQQRKLPDGLLTKTGILNLSPIRLKFKRLQKNCPTLK